MKKEPRSKEVALTLTLFRDEAAEVHQILREHRRRNGVRFTGRRRWLLWTRFHVCGLPAPMEGVRQALDTWGAEKDIQNAW